LISYRRPNKTRRYTPNPPACPFCVEKIVIDYKDVAILSRCITNRGKIGSRRKTRACAKHQRQLATAIKRARFLALLPYAPSHIWESGWCWRTPTEGLRDNYAKKNLSAEEKKRAKKHGFLTRMKTPSGRNIIKRRRLKGRKKLAV